MGGSGGAGFWAFALEFYDRPAAAETLLRLQDDHGADVMGLLWLIWGAALGRRLDADDYRAFKTKTATQRAAAAERRQARRSLKSIGGAQYEAAKVAELAAERQVAAAAPEAVRATASSSPAPVGDNLALAFPEMIGAPCRARELLSRLASTALVD